MRTIADASPVYLPSTTADEGIAQMDGDGWARCRCGQTRCGLHGAAGLLIVSADRHVALQLRSPRSHQGGTWSVPGGARRNGESAVQAAMREAVEEVGVDTSKLTVVGEHTDDHGDWSYTTVLATSETRLDLRPVAETAARWNGCPAECLPVRVDGRLRQRRDQHSAPAADCQCGVRIPHQHRRASRGGGRVGRRPSTQA